MLLDSSSSSCFPSCGITTGFLTLFYAESNPTYFTRGGGIYAPPMISRKKKFFAQFLLHTQTTTQNRVTHQKPGLYLEKQKNGGRFKIAVCNMTGRISSIFCNILHFLPLRTKMALARPILELDL